MGTYQNIRSSMPHSKVKLSYWPSAHSGPGPILARDAKTRPRKTCVKLLDANFACVKFFAPLCGQMREFLKHMF